MLVREAMTSPAVVVRADDSVRSAMQVLLRDGIASVPVLDAEGRLCGMVSEADLLRGRTASDPRGHLRAVVDEGDAPPAVVADVMTARVLTVQVGADLADAARLLLEHGIKAAPVVEGSHVVGVIARRDVLRNLVRPDDDVRTDVLHLLAEQGYSPEWDVSVADGVVTVAGGPAEAADPRLRRLAAVLARTVPGVVRVRS